MISDFPAIVDACVLVQAAVRDTLLRLFEQRLFLARWTDEIIEETVRTLRDKLGRTTEQTDRLVNELRTHFPDAWVEPGYRELIPVMTNHEKDRHVLAAAVKTPCEVIVTYNLKDFPEEALEPFGIEAKHPGRISDRSLPHRRRDRHPRTPRTGCHLKATSHNPRSAALA
jgi:hypothetical protein